MLSKRNILILKIIVEEFIKSGDMIGSKSLLAKYDLWVSSATVRWDMAKLEKLWLIYQPYNSAWRLPTTSWIRVYIDYLMEQTPSFLLNNENINLKNTHNNLYDFIHDKITQLSQRTKEISFFGFIEDKFLEYSWFSFALEKKKNDVKDIIKIIKFLENKNVFLEVIKNFNVEQWIKIFIWEENFINDFKNISILLKPVVINEKKWYIWIIWNISQNYSFNISALKTII